MRSMATPIDHIDMTSSTMATPTATGLIVCHIPIRSTVHPPSSAKLRIDQKPDARLLQREIDRDGHDDWHGLAIECGRRELPLAHSLERRRIEQPCRTQYFGLLDPTIRA